MKYFKGGVNLDPAVSVTDNLDDLLVDVEIDPQVFVGYGEYIDIAELTEPGYYTVRAQAKDSAGNETHVAEMIEIRDRYLHGVTAAIESITVTSLGTEDFVQATLLFASEEVGQCYIDIATLSVNTLGADPATTNHRLRPAADFIVNGSYNPAVVDREDCVTRVLVEGNLPAGTATDGSLDFFVTASGREGEPDAFDVMSNRVQLAADSNANAIFTDIAGIDCNCDDPPGPEPTCRWISNFVPDPVDLIDHRPPTFACTVTPGDPVLCASIDYGMFAAPNAVMGAAYATEWCPPWCGLKMEKDDTVQSGGVLNVQLQGDCCDECDIAVEGRPVVRTKAAINHKATAGASAIVAITAPCGSADAESAAAVSTHAAGTFGISTPYGGATVPYVNHDTEDSDVSDVNDVVCSHNECSITVTVATRGRMEVIAESTIVHGTGEAFAKIYDAQARLKVTPETDCDVPNDGVPIELDECLPSTDD